MKETVEVDRARFRVMLMVAALEGRETSDACTEIADTLIETAQERHARRTCRRKEAPDAEHSA